MGALVLGGGAAALFWKPLLAGIASIVTSNRAGGEIITSYKEQVVLLKESNLELRERNDKNLRRISMLETDLRLIKNALGILLAMTEAGSQRRVPQRGLSPYLNSVGSQQWLR